MDMRAFESLGDMFSNLVENLRSPGKAKFDPLPRWNGGRIKIARKAEDVYAFWRASTNLPKVFRVLQSLTIHEGGVTRWALRGYAGESLAFSCEQVVEYVGKRIEWRSTKDAPVHSTLNVTFTALSDEVSELGVQWSICLRPDHGNATPPTLDGIVDEMTQRMLDDDLDRLRIVLETEGARLRSEASAREVEELTEHNEDDEAGE